MPILESLIARSEASLNFDVVTARRDVRERLPEELASRHDLAARRRFLQDTVGPDSAQFYERIIKGNELQPVNYLERGAIAARAVGRIVFGGASGAGLGHATGFLVAPRVLLTNNHVFEDPETAAAATIEFGYELDLADRPRTPSSFGLRPQDLFFTSPALDFAVCAVEPVAQDGARIADFGFLPALDIEGKAMPAEWLTIVQHPAGQRKQICVRENQLIRRTDTSLWYSTDTLSGSSGSPVFNNDWFIVALHSAGVPERGPSGEILTIDGAPYVGGRTLDSNVKWIANQGTRATLITQTLRAQRASEPLLQPLFNATAESARITGASRAAYPNTGKQESLRMSTPAGFPREIRLLVQADGSAQVLPQAGAREAFHAFVEARKPKPTLAQYGVEFDDDYTTRKGYDPAFLGNGALSIPFPDLGGLKKRAVPLITPPAGKGPADKDFLLHYHNYSVVMHEKRKLAIYSIANVRFNKRWSLPRPSDNWRRDPRIPAEYQLQNKLYADNNFDRGHLTRYEDLEFGDDIGEALLSAADTCHWTNCAPQHEVFNQDPAKELWQGLEKYLLEDSIRSGKFNATLITGPVFDDDDPEYRKTKYPLRFWKVAAALTPAGELFAAGYVLSQEKTIKKYGIEADAPFGQFELYQTPVSEIEDITGLTFRSGADGKGRLADADPSTRRKGRIARSRFNAAESLSASPGSFSATLGPAYRRILSIDDLFV